MSIQDPIADMLIRIKNSQAVGKKEVVMPAAKLKTSLAKILHKEGFIDGYHENENENGQPNLVITLRYFEGKPVILQLDRVSRPGLRRYEGKDKLPKVKAGLGIAIISTSKGIMSDREARRLGLGGEIVCYVS